MTVAKILRFDEEYPDTYHGVKVLSMHVGDPIPTPQAPDRYAVHVSPDLARYLLTFNHERNRGIKSRGISRFVGDMRSDHYVFTPRGLVFSARGILNDGQHQLKAIIEYGSPVWIMLDCGWPEDIINVLDRGSAKTNADGLHVVGVNNAYNVAAAHTKVMQLKSIMGSTRQLAGLPSPSTAEAISAVAMDPEGWQEATNAAYRVYRGLDKGGAPTLWAACYRLIYEVHPAKVADFFDEIAEGSGEPRSASRKLGDFFRRRPTSAAMQTGDAREPFELVIRAFNAWLVNRSYATPKYKGFVLSPVHRR